MKGKEPIQQKPGVVLFPVLLLCFFLSGATSLVYEVLWVRMLILSLGSTSLAISTVVTAFMAGLALGAQGAGHYLSRTARPLRVYALLELGIALSALLMPAALAAMEPVYRLFWESFRPQFLTFSLLRFCFTFLLLFVPTVLMGATLPVLSQASVRNTGEAGRRVGTLYGINTLGAVVGTTASGFFLMPLLGITRTLWLAVAVNALLALGAWGLDRASGFRKPDPRKAEPAAPITSWEELNIQGNWLRITVLAALLASGFTSMVYQVAWTRTLSLLIGSSVYAFTIVLVTFLVGISLGSLLISRWLDLLKGSLAWWIVLAQILIVCTAYATSSLVNLLPFYYTRGYHWLEADPGWLHLLGFAVSALVILPSTLGMGAMFPLSIAFFYRSLEGVGRLVGNLYFLNTLGAILGAFSGGVVLLALLGIRTTLLSAITMNLYVAALVAFFVPSSRRKRLLGGLLPLGLVALFMIVPPGWNPLLMSSGMFQYASILEKDFSENDFWRLTEGDYHLLFYEEGLTTTISVLFNGQDVILINNGKIDASNRIDIPTQSLLGHLPLLFHPRPRDVCVIGLGSGMSAGSALLHPIDSLTLLEIESAVLKASHYFDDVNNQPLADPRTEVVVADGRNYLVMTDRKFDVIISEPPNPWMTGVANLFTREFFQAAHSRLRADGILAQWLELYSLPPDGLRSILASYLSVFPHVQIFLTIEETDLVVLGSNSPLLLDLPLLGQRLARPEVAGDLVRSEIHDVADLISYFKIGENEIRAFAAGSPWNTDDNMRIEFSAPLHLGYDTGYIHEEDLNEATAGPMPYLVGFEDSEERIRFLASLEKAYRKRERVAEAELVAESLRDWLSRTEAQQ